uniref:Leucine-rich repeat containing protein n=1 Tax=Strongyloides papillosus TaxID=174720 RepID=A0A0N5CFG7_STREA
MECQLAIVKTNSNQRVRYSNVLLTLTNDPPKTIRHVPQSPLGIEIKKSSEPTTVIPLFENSIDKILTNNINGGMITIIFNDPKKIMYIKHGNKDYLNLLVLNLNYLKNGDLDKINLKHLTMSTRMPTKLAIDSHTKLKSAPYSEFVTSLTLNVKYDKMFCQILRGCEKLEILCIKKAFESSKVSLPKMFFYALLGLKKLKNFTFSENFLFESDDITSLLESLTCDLVSLNLEDNGVTEFPDKFEKFQNLRVLNLGNNCMKTIPCSLTFLKDLIALDITTKNVLLLYLPIRCWNSFPQTEVTFGARSENGIIRRPHGEVIREIKESCYCYSHSPPKFKEVCSLTEICIANGNVIRTPITLPYNIQNDLSTAFYCDLCFKLRYDDGHHCQFSRRIMAFGRQFTMPHMGNVDLSIYCRTKLCKYCYASNPTPFIVDEDLQIQGFGELLFVDE